MADAASRGKWTSLDSGPLFGLQMSVTRRPWRISPAWAVVGGTLAAGAPLANGPALLRLVGAIILADALWGGLWSLMACGPAQAERDETWGLPYLQPAAPIVDLSKRLSELASGAGCHELLAGVVLALGLAALLGVAALALTVGALVCALCAQLVSERGLRPALPYALLSLGLPWALGLSLAGSAALVTPGPLALGAAFVVLEWGAQRLRWQVPATWRVLAGEAAVVTVLVALRLPWAVPLVVALFMPPSWWLLRARAQGAGGQEVAIPALPIDFGAMAGFAASRSAVWWWLALILSAAAVRQLTVM